MIDGFETCGPTSFMSCLNAVGYNTKLVDGVQEEDIVTAFFRNKNNYAAFQRIRELDYDEVPANRVPQLYPYMGKRLFGARVEFFMGDIRNRVIDAIKKFCSVQICFDNPGHYIAAVGYDEGNHEIIYNDPLGGFNLRFNDNRFDAFRNWGNIIYPS
jgi:hypothetical protein